MSLPAFRATEPQVRAILTHYERVAPFIVASFAKIPLATTYYIDGLGTEPTFSGGTWHKPLPASIPRTTVTTPSGVHTYPRARRTRSSGSCTAAASACTPGRRLRTIPSGSVSRASS